MKRILNKLSLGVMTITPILIVASCSKATTPENGEGTNETPAVVQTNDGKIKILSSFSAGGYSTKALKELIKVYNETQKDVDGFMPVSIVQSPNGYSGASEDIKTKITSKDAKSLYNLTFNYPNIVSYLSDKFMELKFNGEIVGTNEAIREKFESNFIGQNDHIGATKPGNIYSIPSQVSGLNVSYNSPVLTYMIAEAIKKGASIKGEDRAFYEALFEKSDITLKDDNSLKFNDKTDAQVEYNKVAEIWGVAEGSQFNSFSFDKDTFTNVASVLDFAVRAQKTFANSANKSANNSGKKLRVFGIDDIASLIYLSAFSKAEGDLNNYIIKEGDRKGFIFYDIESFLSKKDSKEYKLFKKVIDQFIPSINAQAIYLGGGGKYSSAKLTKHEIAFSIGSTAGYRFNYAPDSKKINAILKAEKKAEIKAGKKVIEPADSESEKDIASFKNGRYTNHIYASDIDASKLKQSSLKYQYIVTNAGDDAKIIAFLQAAKTAKVDIALTTDNFDLSSLLNSKDGLAVTVYKNTKAKTGKRTLTFIKNTKTISAASNSTSLQKTELATAQFIGKYDKDSKVAPVLVQGPSLIGIKANKEEDKATRLFVKFFLSKEKRTFKSIFPSPNPSPNIIATPLEYFSKSTGYIIPTKDAFNKGVDPKDNDFVKDIKKGFAQAIKNQAGKVLFAEPADSNTDKVREAIRVSFASVLLNLLTNDSKTVDSDDLIGDIKDVSK